MTVYAIANDAIATTDSSELGFEACSKDAWMFLLFPLVYKSFHYLTPHACGDQLSCLSYTCLDRDHEQFTP